MGTVVKSYLEGIIEDVEKRLPNIKEQVRIMEDAISKKGDWRKVEDAGRLLFRLNKLSLKKEASKLVEMPTGTAEGFNVLERIIKENELMPISFMYKGALAARTVGRVVVRNDDGIMGYGTGFMISPNLMITNHHVLEDVSTARYSLFEMNYRETDEGLSNSEFFRLEPDEFFIANEHLDFAIVAVDVSNSNGSLISKYGFNKIIKESGKAVVGECVNLVQHPAGEPKQIVIRNNKIIGIKDEFVHYVADTMKGSSGCVVYNDNFEVVALHHAGKPARDSHGNILLTDGTVWDGSRLTMDMIHWEANEGIRISKIFEYLDSIIHEYDAPKQRLYQEIFTSTPAISNIWNESTSNIGNVNQVVNEPDGSLSMYLKVNFSGATALPSISVKDTDSGNGHVLKPTNGHNKHTAKVIVDNAYRNHDYYNEETDINDRKSYYGNIDLNDSPDALFKALSKHINNTHAKVLCYREARHEYLYPLVDIHEFGKLRNIYSGDVLSPEEIISKELDLIERYEHEFNSILTSESYHSDQERLEAYDMFEASLPFNCEHVVPQSWFNKRNPMRADLHHLFTCEPTCNSFRSNIPYWEFGPLDEIVRTKCGRRESNKFEPLHGHGAVARATLYFLLRYPGEVGDANREMQKDRLSVLLGWHKSNPVTRYELHRNYTIFEIQGNRNPLIDYPDLADKINFNLGID
ncbi:endonuclease I [Labilibacter sediminis]|nr:endonuclease I [Labilibacter sediminis]